MRPRRIAPTKPVQSLCLSLASSLLFACSGSHPRSYQGYCEGEFVYLASSQSGRLEHLAVARGQQVVAGTPLFALEDTEEKAAQHQAQQQMAAAEAQLADLATGKRPAEVGVIRAQLAQAQAEAGKSALPLEVAAAFRQKPRISNRGRRLLGEGEQRLDRLLRHRPR